MKKLILIFIVTTFFSSKGIAVERSRLYTEFGLSQNTFNQVRIPGDDGTKVNLRKSFPDESAYFRLDYKNFFENGYGLRLLYAPLKLQGEHTYSKDIDFNGSVFNKNTKTKTLYLNKTVP